MTNTLPNVLKNVYAYARAYVNTSAIVHLLRINICLSTKA